MKLRKIKYFILFFLAILILPSNVFAKSEITLVTDKSSLETNDEILVTANISSDTKLYALTATLSYDEAVFEAIDDKNFENKGDWSEVIYNSSNKKFGLINKSGEIENTLLSVHLKVKEGANVGKTNITLSNISASDGKETITFPSSSAEVFVSRNANGSEVIPNNNSNYVSSQITPEETENNNENGSFLIIPIIIALGVIVFICILAYSLIYIFNIKFKKYILISSSVLIAITICTLGIYYAVNSANKDVNNDGEINYEDAKEIIKYIIDINGDENKNENNTSNELIEPNLNNVIQNTTVNSNDNSENNSYNGGNTNSSGNSSNNGSSTSSNNNGASSSRPSSSNSNNSETSRPSSNSSSKPNTNNQSNNTGTTSKPSTPSGSNSSSQNNPSTQNKPSTPSKPNTTPSTPSTPSKPNTTPSTPSNPNTPSKPNKPNGDVNNDGKVDIEDAAGSTQGTTENTKYKVKIEQVPILKYYLNKGENLTIEFVATVTPNETIKQVIVDGKTYNVVKNASTYSVTVKAPNTAGVHEFNISKVILSNKRAIDVSLKLKFEILKNAPSISSFKVDDETNEITFIVNDPDNAFVNGRINIVDSKNNNILDEKIEKAENSFIGNLEKDEKYKVTIICTYDLDIVNGGANTYTNKIILNEDVTLYNKYNFKVSKAEISKTITKGEAPIISFESTNSTEYNVKSVIIENKEYKVVKGTKNTYKVILPENEVYGKYALNINEIILSNGKSFKNNKDFKVAPLTYAVLKIAPKVEEIELTENDENKTISAKFKINDEDSTLISVNASLVDGNGEIIEVKENLPINEEVQTQTFSYNENNTVKFKVLFTANYNLGVEGYNYENKEIGNKEVYAKSNIYFTNAVVSTKYPNKNQEMYLTYDVFVDPSYNKIVGNLITGITVNGYNYTAKRTSAKDNIAKYVISFKTPDEAGLINIEGNRIMFSDGTFVWVKPMELKIDVLKDEPKIENIVVSSEDYEKGEVTLEFDLVDDVNENNNGAFESGTITLEGETKEITNGHNTITFNNLQKDKLLNLSISVNFDLDSNVLDTESNHYENKNILLGTYILRNPKRYDNIKVLNVKPVSKKNNVYFEKNEDVKLNFEITGLEEGMEVTKIVAINKTYEVKKNENTYTAVINGFENAGVKNFEITDVILNSGKKVTLKEPSKASLEVLKDDLSITNFSFNLTGNNIVMNMKLKDTDKCLTDGVKIKVVDEDGKNIGEFKYNDSISFAKKTGILRYHVTALANYDRDSNKLTTTDNKYTNKVILDEVISLDKNYIEMKDITSIELYKNENGNSVLKETVTKAELDKNLSSYFVKISMSNMPAVYSKIKEVLIENNHLILVLNYEYAATSDGKVVKNLRVDFGEIKNNVAKNEANPETFSSLIEKIKQNPAGTYVLDHDLDASELNVETNTLTDVDFTGTFDGNGHTIKNLTKPLFKTLNGGTVKNLKLKNVTFPATNAHGSVADSANKGTISGVLVDGFDKTNSEGAVGGIVGSAVDTTIENSKVTGLKINSTSHYQQIGGIVGVITNSKVINCYVIGQINSGWHFQGGLVGMANINGGGTNASTIQNCYTKVTLNSGYGEDNNNGIIGSGNAILINNVSLSTGNSGFKVCNGYKEAKNNYQLVESNYKKNEEAEMFDVKMQDVNANFFKEKALFDEDIWNLNYVSYDEPPTFKAEITSSLDSEKMKENSLYDKNKILLYHNLELLIPFYDTNSVIKNGAEISASHILNKQEIMHIIPVDKNGHLVTYLTTNNYKKIAKIKIIFKNNDVKEYEVRFDKIYDMVVGYRIPSLKIDYCFNHYMINENSKLVSNLVSYLSNLDYEKDLDVLTETKDSRLYRDHYNSVTKKELKEFVLKYLSNSNNAVAQDQDLIANYVEKDLKYNNKLKKVLYVYNYFRRWYSVDINGISLNDLVFFNSKGFNTFMNPDDITATFLSNEANFATNATNDSYKRTLEKYTNISTIPRLLEYYVNALSNETVDEWYAKSFKGYLVEVKVKGREDIKYTLWSHIQYEDAKRTVWHNYALVLLTLPKNAAYIISSPTQFAIGAQKTYVKNPNDAEDAKALKEIVNEFAKNIETYYTTAAAIIGDSKYFNEIHTIQIDHRFTLDSNGNTEYQSRYVTEEDFHKNFNEAVNMWKEMDGNNATANGTVIFFNAVPILKSYGTWSHETAHNIDSRLFMKNYGRRYDAGGEDYSDGNLAQRWGDGEINMNLSLTFDQDKLMAANWTPERINSLDKIQDYYRKLFEVYYILDYLEAQAFLQLTPEEQARVAVQVSYPNKDLPDTKVDEKGNEQSQKHLQYKTTRYTAIGEEEYRNMELKTINDLYDNKIVIYPTVILSNIADNRYGSENIYKTRWYQPHNDYGRPDSYSLKAFAFEMLGYAGYDDGYIEYYSNKEWKNDLDALRKITGNSEMTFEKYKKDRFKYVEDNLKYIQYIDVNKLVKDFYYAYKEDAKKVEDAEKTENTNTISNARKLEKRTEVRRQAFYKIKRETNDFVSEVYDKSKPQEVGSFIIEE